MERRRLSPLAQMALQAAHEIYTPCEPARFVFGSRHGEIVSNTQMMKAISRNEPVSPAAFSHSVHNAIPGLWSMHNGQTGECSAISAGKDTLPMACLEASLILASDRTSPILVVVADECLPVEFAGYEQEPTEPFALALRIEDGPPNLKLSAYQSDGMAPDPIDASIWHNWWKTSERPLTSPGERHHWEWARP